MIVSISLFQVPLQLVFTVYIFVKFLSLSFRNLFSEPFFVTLILHNSADHFVLQCFDTDGWALSPAAMTYYVSGGTLNLTHSLTPDGQDGRC